MNNNEYLHRTWQCSSPFFKSTVAWIRSSKSLSKAWHLNDILLTGTAIKYLDYDICITQWLLVCDTCVILTLLITGKLCCHWFSWWFSTRWLGCTMTFGDQMLLKPSYSTVSHLSRLPRDARGQYGKSNERFVPMLECIIVKIGDTFHVR